MTALLTITLPIRTINAKNTREHWRKRAARTAEERNVAKMAVLAQLKQPRGTPFTPPWIVTLTRLSPSLLDSHENLPLAMSGCVDGVADALGIKDNDPRVQWRYGQEKTRSGRRGEIVHRYGVRIVIEAAQ